MLCLTHIQSLKTVSGLGWMEDHTAKFVVDGIIIIIIGIAIVVGQPSVRQATSKFKSSDSLLKCGYEDANILLLFLSPSQL